MTLPTISFVGEFAGGDAEIGDAVRNGFSCSRGSLQPSLTGLIADSGSLSTTLENFDRKYDPTHTSSPLYPDVVPGVGFKAVATYAAVDYPFFTGRIPSWSQTYGTAGLDQIVAITALDAVSALGKAKFTGTFGPQPAGERMLSLLDRIDWPGDIAIDGGTARMPSADVGGYAWSVMSDACAAEWGYLWVTGDGVVTFLDRNGIFAAAAAASSPPIFGDQAGELPYWDIQVDYDDTRIVNDADLGYGNAGKVANAEDLTSQGEPWGVNSWSQNLQIESPALAISYVTHVVHTYTDPTVRFSQIEIHPEDQPADLWPIVLGLEPGQKFTIKRTPQGGGARIELDVYVRGFEHTLDGGEWTTRVELDDASLVTVVAHMDDGHLMDGNTLMSF